jgi:hypothetical protein
MLKVFSCDCGYEREVEHPEYYNVRLRCPNCGVFHTHVAFADHSRKLIEVFEDSVRLLSRRHSEKAAQGFAQFYVLWLKHVIAAKEPSWPERKKKPNIRALADRIKNTYGIAPLTLIEKDYRNKLEHDQERLTTYSEAADYAEHVLATMERNLIELMGEDTWRKGEAGELDSFMCSDSDERIATCLRYWHHYRSGTIGYVKTAGVWWAAHKAGRGDWHRASWTRPATG